MSAQVRELIVSLLGTGRCTIALVAQHMGVDRRTIHRQLASEGQSSRRSSMRCDASSLIAT